MHLRWKNAKYVVSLYSFVPIFKRLKTIKLLRTYTPSLNPPILKTWYFLSNLSLQIQPPFLCQFSNSSYFQPAFRLLCRQEGPA